MAIGVTGERSRSEVRFWLSASPETTRDPRAFRNAHDAYASAGPIPNATTWRALHPDEFADQVECADALKRFRGFARVLAEDLSDDDLVRALAESWDLARDRVWRWDATNATLTFPVLTIAFEDETVYIEAAMARSFKGVRKPFYLKILFINNLGGRQLAFSAPPDDDASKGLDADDVPEDLDAGGAPASNTDERDADDMPDTDDTSVSDADEQDAAPSETVAQCVDRLRSSARAALEATGRPTEADQNTLRDLITDKALVRWMRSPERPAEVLILAFDAAARLAVSLTGHDLAARERNLVHRVIAGTGLPDISELSLLGFTTLEANRIENAWKGFGQIDRTPHDLISAFKTRPSLPAAALLGILTGVGGKGAVARAFQELLRWLCDGSSAGLEAARRLLDRYRDRLVDACPHGPTMGMAQTALSLACDGQPDKGAAYAQQLIAFWGGSAASALGGMRSMRCALALCQALAGLPMEDPAAIDASCSLMSSAAMNERLVRALVARYGESADARHVLAVIARDPKLSRAFLLAYPGVAVHEEPGCLSTRLQDFGAGRAARSLSDDDVDASVLLSYAAGAAPSWLSDRALPARRRGRTGSDAGDGVDAGWFPVFRAARSDEPDEKIIAAYAAAQASALRHRFAATQLASRSDAAVQPCIELLDALSVLDDAAVSVAAAADRAREAACMDALRAVLDLIDATERDDQGDVDRQLLAPVAEAVEAAALERMVHLFAARPDALSSDDASAQVTCDRLARRAWSRAERVCDAPGAQETLRAFAAAGARGMTMRARAALAAHYALTVQPSRTGIAPVYQKATTLAGFPDMGTAYYRSVLECGSMAAFRVWCRALSDFVAQRMKTVRRVDRAFERVVTRKETPDAEALTRDVVTVQSAVARFIEHPEYTPSSVFAIDLYQAFFLRRRRKCAAVAILGFVDVWQLTNLTNSIKWVFLQSNRISSGDLARSLPALANLMVEYLEGGFPWAVEASRRSGDERTYGALGRFGSTLAAVVEDARARGIIARGYGQETALRALLAALRKAAQEQAAHTGSVELDAAADALDAAIVQAFPEQVDLATEAVRLPERVLIERFVDAVEAEDRRAHRADIELIVDELERRGRADEERAPLAAWIAEVADALPEGPGPLPAYLSCCLALFETGAHPDSDWRCAADAIAALVKPPGAAIVEDAVGEFDDEGVGSRMAMGLLVRFKRIFPIGPQWVSRVLHRLLDAVAAHLTSSDLVFIGEIHDSVADAAASLARANTSRETARVAFAMSGTRPELMGDPMLAAYVDAWRRVARELPDWTGMISAALLCRRWGPVCDRVAEEEDPEIARRLGFALAPAFARRPEHLTRALLRRAYWTTRGGVGIADGTRALIQALGDDRLTELVTEVERIATSGDGASKQALEALVGPESGVRMASLEAVRAALDGIEAAEWEGCASAEACRSARAVTCRVARAIQPTIRYLDPAQRLIFQGDPWIKDHLDDGFLDEAGAAYLALVLALTTAELPPQDELNRVRDRLVGRVEVLPAELRAGASSLLDAVPARVPMRPSFALNGRFTGFARVDQQESADLGDLIALGRKLLRPPADDGRDPLPDAAWLDAVSWERDEAARFARAWRAGTAPRALDELIADAAGAEAVGGPQRQLYLAVLACIMGLACATGDDERPGGRAVKRLASQLARLTGAITGSSLDELEDAAGSSVSLLMEDAPADGEDEGATATAASLRPVVEAAVRRIVDQVAANVEAQLADVSFAMEADALERASQGALALARFASPHAAHDGAAAALLAHLVSAQPDADGTVVAAWAAAARAFCTGDACAALARLRALLQAFPQAALEAQRRLAEGLDRTESLSASLVEVEIVNTDFDGNVYLVMRCAREGAPAQMRVDRVTARCGDVEVALTLTSSEWLPVACGAEVPWWHAIDLAPEDLDEGALVELRVDVASHASNRWEVACTVPAARGERALGMIPYDEEAQITAVTGACFERDGELDQIKTILVRPASRQRGVRIVGPKGVGKTALARRLMEERIEIEGSVNLFGATTCSAYGVDVADLMVSLLADASRRALAHASAPGAAGDPEGFLDGMGRVLDSALSEGAPDGGRTGIQGRREVMRLCEELKGAGFALTCVVDEAQRLKTAAPWALRALARVTEQLAGVLAWVFVGTDDLVDLGWEGASAADPAYTDLVGRGTEVLVRHFPAGGARVRAIRQMLGNDVVRGVSAETPEGSFSFSDDAIRFLASYAGGFARPTLKIANAVRGVMALPTGEVPASSPFVACAKRTVYAADIRWVLDGDGVSARQLPYESVASDFREVRGQLGVEEAMRAITYCCIVEGAEDASLKELRAAAQLMRDAAALEVRDDRGGREVLGCGIDALERRGYLDTSDGSARAGAPFKRYRISSELYRAFADAVYRGSVESRMAASQDLTDRELEQERRLTAERLDAFAENRVEELERELRERDQELSVVQGKLDAAQQAHDTAVRALARAGGDTYIVHNGVQMINKQTNIQNRTSVRIDQLTVNYLGEQLTQVGAALVKALGGQGTDDARVLADALPWPDDRRFMTAVSDPAALTASSEPDEDDAAVTPPSYEEGADAASATPPADDDVDEARHRAEQAISERDASYAAYLALAGERVLGTDQEGLRSWLAVEDNRRILARVGVDAERNSLFQRALAPETTDADVFATCRSVCVSAMIHGLLDVVGGDDNFAPVASLLTQECEYLWKRRLMPAIGANPTACKILLNWDTGGRSAKFTKEFMPLEAWLRQTDDLGLDRYDRADLGRFARIGACPLYKQQDDKPQTDRSKTENPWDGPFPCSGESAPWGYLLGPSYARLGLAGMDEEDQAIYRTLAYATGFDRGGEFFRVNNLDVLAHALGDADGSLSARYQDLVRYFTALSCVRSLRNGAAHAGRAGLRGDFGRTSSLLLFRLTVGDGAPSSGADPALPRLRFRVTGVRPHGVGDERYYDLSSIITGQHASTELDVTIDRPALLDATIALTERLTHAGAPAAPVSQLTSF